MAAALQSAISFCRVSHGRIGWDDDHAPGAVSRIAPHALRIAAGAAEQGKRRRCRTQGDEENAKDAEAQDQVVKAAGRPGITRFAKDVRIGKHHGSSLNRRMRTRTQFYQKAISTAKAKQPILWRLPAS